MPWYDEVPIVLPPMVYFIDQRPNRYIAAVWDEPNEEITHVAFKNRTSKPWRIVYSWKGKDDQVFIVPPMTGHTEIGIPPGQRKFIPTTIADRDGFESEIAGVEG